MKWTPVVCAVWLAGLTGCPHAFGRGGSIDRAAEKDVKENLGPQRRDCTAEDRARFCANGQQRSEACLRVCGVELEEDEDW